MSAVQDVERDHYLSVWEQTEEPRPTRWAWSFDGWRKGEHVGTLAHGVASSRLKAERAAREQCLALGWKAEQLRLSYGEWTAKAAREVQP